MRDRPGGTPKRLFLASTGSTVLPAVARRIGPTAGLKVLFVTTAAEPEPGDWPWITGDRQALAQAGFSLREYSISGRSREAIAAELRASDILYVAGGNTFFLLAKIQQSGCGDVIREFVSAGKIYIGVSAGAVVAGPDTYPAYIKEDVDRAPGLEGYQGLGLVEFVPLTHWGNDYYRDFYLGQRMPLAYGLDNKYIAVSDRQFIEVQGDFCRIFSADEPLFQ